jgi:hypothetical protein
MQNNELRHYGVLGMKWGVRRYQNADGSLTALGKKHNKTYTYTSQATKKREKKAAKAEAKGASNAKELRARATASQKFDDQQLSYAKTTSVGKSIVQKALLSTAAARTYDMARSAGYSRGRSFLKSMFDVNTGITGLSVQQYLMREDYINNETGTKKKTVTKDTTRKAAVNSNYAKQAKYILDNSTSTTNNSKSSSSKASSESTYKPTLGPDSDAYKKAKSASKNSNFSYADIYKEMGVDLSSDDPDDYREAEYNYYKKHGYLS